MDDYIERVNRCASERTGEPVFNGSVDHARVIAAAMFKNARRYIDVFSGSFNGRVYGQDDVLDEADGFLSNSTHKLRIILEDADDRLLEQHSFFKRFGKYSNVEIKLLPKGIGKGIPFHLMVADGDCYRFEQDKTQVAAIAAWGDAKGGANLKGIFDALWQAAKPLSA